MKIIFIPHQSRKAFVRMDKQATQKEYLEDKPNKKNADFGHELITAFFFRNPNVDRKLCSPARIFEVSFNQQTQIYQVLTYISELGYD